MFLLNFFSLFLKNRAKKKLKISPNGSLGFYKWGFTVVPHVRFEVTHSWESVFQQHLPKTIFQNVHKVGVGKFCFFGCGNDPSAGSPTETLLRLLLPLNDQV